MPIQNDFLPFAAGAGANVLTQAQYAALTSLIANGFSAGVAPSAQLNKVWRQSSIMTAVLAQFIVANTGQTAIDDGTTATLLANLATAISVTARQNPVLTDTGAANAYVVANLAAFTAYPTVSGLTLDVSIANTNTGASTLNVDGLGAKPILGLGLQALQGGELPAKGVACLLYVVASTVNSGNGAWVVMECTGGAQQVAPATQSQHAMQLGQATGRLLAVRQFTAGGTYTPTVGTTSVIVEQVGGGGGGGGTFATGAGQVSAAGGGGSGSYARGRFTSGFSGVTMTIGAAGAGGAAGNAGGSGGTTSFGALMSTPGGLGGAVGANGAAPPYGQFADNGGAAPSGANIDGARGASGELSIALSVSSFKSGGGGASRFGPGGAGLGTSTTNGNPSTTPGAGGGGATTGSGIGAGNTGGNGASGMIIVHEYS